MLDKNSFAFVWHSFWLSLTETFTDKNSVMPGLILLVGGSQTDIGILTAIIIGVPLISQIIFTSLLFNKTYKKKYLLYGMYLRVAAFIGVALSISLIKDFSSHYFISILFFWMSIFSISGAFAGIAYNDLLGKSVEYSKRKNFFVIKQFTTSVGILFSAFVLKKMLIGFEFPDNYKYGFILAGILLFIGSVAYYFVKERPTELNNEEINILKIIKSIPAELRKNKTFASLIIVSNLIGFSLTVTPFFIAYIKNKFEINNELISNFLLFQIVGMILSNLFWRFLINKIGFKGMIKITVILYALTPIASLILSNTNELRIYSVLFLFVGAAISANRIATDGALIEITNDSNRVLYTGIYGSLNIVSALFPLLISVIIKIISYESVFIIVSVITIISFHYINRMFCPFDEKNIIN